MQKYLLLGLILLAMATSATAETMTLTTYYPAPSGRYVDMRAKRMTVGTTYMPNSLVGVTDNNLIVEGSVGIGTPTPTTKLEVSGTTTSQALNLVPNNESMSPNRGDIYYDTATNTPRFYNGTSWVGMGGGSMPTGAIIMWSGSIATIPAGWALCDGSNGTPNLRDRFVVGAGSSYAVGANGGAATVTLTTAQMPAHHHTGSTSSDGNHSHRYSKQSGSTTASGSNNQAATPGSVNTDTGGGGSHSHTFTTNNTGSGTAHENRPPYYALCFIMKL